MRLYLGSDIARRHGSVDLYDSFTSIAQDEEDFRSELVRYAEAADDGRPLVTPMDVAPLVTQRLPWLKPSSPNKMYNAVIIGNRAWAESFSDLFAMKNPGDGANAKNIQALSRVLPRLAYTGEFEAENESSYGVQYGIVGAQEVVEFLDSMVFFDSEIYKPRIDFIRSRVGPQPTVLTTSWCTFPRPSAVTPSFGRYLVSATRSCQSSSAHVDPAE